MLPTNRFYIVVENGDNPIYAAAGARLTTDRALAVSFGTWPEAYRYIYRAEGVVNTDNFIWKYASKKSRHPQIVGDENNQTCSRLSEVIQEAGFGLCCNDAYFTMHCPFHPDLRSSLRVNTVKDKYECIVCGAKGGLRKMAKRLGINVISDIPADDDDADDSDKNYILAVMAGGEKSGKYLKPFVPTDPRSNRWYCARPGKRNAIQFTERSAASLAKLINSDGDSYDVELEHHVYRSKA